MRLCFWRDLCSFPSSLRHDLSATYRAGDFLHVYGQLGWFHLTWSMMISVFSH